MQSRLWPSAALGGKSQVEAVQPAVNLYFENQTHLARPIPVVMVFGDAKCVYVSRDYTVLAR